MSDYQLIVIGAGPGGYTAALRAAKLGLKTAVVENRQAGGTCLNRGCVPTKTLLHSSQIYSDAVNGAHAGIHTEKISANLEEIFAYKRHVSETLSGGIESMFKAAENKDRYIITHVVFAFSRKAEPKLDYGHISEAVLARAGGDLAAVTPQMVRETIVEIRKQKLPEPSELGSAGSFFKNPVVSVETYEHVVAVAKEMAAKNGTEIPAVPHYDLVAEDGTPVVKIPAAWLIEQCGWKGRRSGNAAVYSKQPLVIVNFTGMAEPEEIVSLESKVIVSVRERFGIVLSPEVEHI